MMNHKIKVSNLIETKVSNCKLNKKAKQKYNKIKNTSPKKLYLVDEIGY